MRCFRGSGQGSGQQRQNRCTAGGFGGFCKRTLLASRAGCLRLSMPFRRLVRPFRGCFGAPNSDAEPVTQVNDQAPRSSKAAPVAVLMPEYEGPILNPVASSQHTVLNGVMFVDCIATTGSQATVGATIADITPSEAGAACDMSSSDHLDTALAALDSAAGIRTGNTLPLSAIPVGTALHNVEMHPGKGGQLARSAGTSARLVSKDEKYVVVRLPSGEQRSVLGHCMATVGAVSNPQHKNVKIGKAGAARWLGRRPVVRGMAMNPVDHPHGGGRGKRKGRISQTPWGVPTKGYRTRKSNRTDQYIRLSRHKAA